eukprot:677717-Lingulodinium_polyedra.AAC.1
MAVLTFALLSLYLSGATGTAPALPDLDDWQASPMRGEKEPQRTALAESYSSHTPVFRLGSGAPSEMSKTSFLA